MGKANVKTMAAATLFATAVAAVLALCAPNAAWAIDEREPNNTFNTAQSISLGTTVYGSAYGESGGSYSGGSVQNQYNIGDPDFFVVNVPTNTTYKFSYCNDSYGSDNIWFDFYSKYYERIRPSGWMVFNKSGYDVKPQSGTINLSAGINYIYVNGPANAAQYHFKLSPIISKSSVKRLSASKTTATVKWAKKLGTTQYQIRYSTKSSMSGAKVKSVSGAKTSLKVKKLKKNKKYYFQVRVVKNIQGKNFYSGWSVKKSIRTKR